ncbi:hypothetical protein [Paraburkholderia acidiphila]|uniref:Uncharacterized protein n=1 Tax=Paraburkholderia acidiphila TaxID=2571747 RepID=A0A7Z2G4I9_9BURK|nr:hypothetical protein [Paraburkholderia acidiphila]QGZ55078.1 hypothetical protein FAZ97_09190 [Paraburkholderia acidiphila]
MHIDHTKQRNTPLSVTEATARLEPFGLTLTSKHIGGVVTTSTFVDVVCATGHKMRRRYGDIRKRGCPYCKAPFGERVLYGLLRHYVVGPDDWKRMVVRGLDPKDPKRKVIFDAASPTRKIAIENHSGYHEPGRDVPIFQRSLSNAERLRLDGLKEARATNGRHQGGPLNGWRVGVVWFEADRLAKLSRATKSYLPIVIDEFKSIAKLLRLKLRSDDVEIDATKVFAALGRKPLERIGREFDLMGPWRGIAYVHRWRHSCGGEFTKLARALENKAPGKTGCPFCDKEGRYGRWLNFLGRLEQHGYRFAGRNRYSICTEHQVVPLRCVTHPSAKVRKLTRSDIYKWLDAPASRSLPPPCMKCRVAYTQHMLDKMRQHREAERLKLNERLELFGFTMVTMLPTSTRDSKTGAIHAQRNEIQCLNCGYRWSVFVAQRLSKAKRSGQMSCPNCDP